MLTVAVIIGTRPEAIKMVPLILKIRESERMRLLLIATAQHRDLLDQVLMPFGIKPDIDLNLMRPGQTIAEVNRRVLRGVARVFEENYADILLVHGDTTTAFAAALAGFYAKIKVGHVEAGLRSFDKHRPFPEEINRKLVTQLSDLHFAPTALSRENLLRDGVDASAIHVTGNTALDLFTHTVRQDYAFKSTHIEQLDFSKRLVVVTAHRRESLGAGIRSICRAVLRIATQFPDVHVVWPVHPAPDVAEPVKKILGSSESVTLCRPLDVFDMHNLLSRAYLCLTDSGGLQEEAPSFDLPVVVLREVTERPEGIDAGTLVLAGVDEASIFNHTARLLTNSDEYAKMAAAQNPYGDGQASRRIYEALLAREGTHD